MKFVSKESLFKAVLPDMYIDWDYLKNQSVFQQAGKKNLLGYAGIWLHLVQFMEFGQLALPMPVLQARYCFFWVPVLWSRHLESQVLQAR
jgi:hypothetical protein